MSQTGKKKILIIDDDVRNIFALSAVLKAKGFACASALSTAEGLKRLDNEDADAGIILLDMMMPEMDGYQTIAALRQGKLSKLPVVAVTAQAMAGDRERCLEAGADDYISKPVDVDKLLVILNRYL